MKIALAQMEVVPGQPQQNFRNMQLLIREAAEKYEADLIAFPEMCIGGYLLGDRWTDDSFVDDLMCYNSMVADFARTSNIAVAYGNIFKTDEMIGQDGRAARFNAVYIYDRDGTPARRINGVGVFNRHGVTFKTNLPNYRFFDDERYWLSMTDYERFVGVADPAIFYSPFKIAGRKVGFALCEDLWCRDYVTANGPINPTLWMNYLGAEAVVNLSASPWTYGKHWARDNAVAFVAKEVVNRGNQDFKPLFYVNAVGPQNNGKNIITFDGGSTVYNKLGHACYLMNTEHRQELGVFDLNEAANAPTIDRRPARDPIAEKYAAIIEGLRYFKTMSGMDNDPMTVIGLSGGIDSAVSACLFVEAYGRDKVVTINMPTQYNSEATKEAAKALATNLNVPYITLPIGALVKLNMGMLRPLAKDGEIPQLVQENIQAKIRGASILSNAAQMLGGIFSNNGNKLEVFLGYATLYGDWGGAIAPLGDLTKAEVYDMARYINKRAGRDLIPTEMIPDEFYQFGEDKIKPSAELKDDQVDPIKVGYHDAIVAKLMDYRKANPKQIMQAWLDGKLPQFLGINERYMDIYGLRNAKAFIEDLTWLVNTMYGAVFKRVQSVPIIVTSKTAFGYDYRESILPREHWITDEMKMKMEEVYARGSYG